MLCRNHGVVVECLAAGGERERVLYRQYAGLNPLIIEMIFVDWPCAMGV